MASIWAMMLVVATLRGTPTAEAKTRAQSVALPSGTQTVLGVHRGHTIYRGKDGQLFYLEPATGRVTPAAAGLKYRAIKGGAELVTILLIDAKGNVLQLDAKGIAFYLNLKTGARVFVKWPK